MLEDPEAVDVDRRIAATILAAALTVVPLLGCTAIGPSPAASLSPTATELPSAGPPTFPPLEQANRIDAVVSLIQAYAADHPESFAGIWIDHPTVGPARVASSWARDLETHREWITARVDTSVPLTFVAARYTEAELDSLRDRITADMAWLEAIPAHVLGLGTDVKSNRVDLDVSSAVPGVGLRIIEHFAIPANMIVVNSDGTGGYFVPWGNVRVKVVDATGRGPGDDAYYLGLEGDEPPIRGTECGHGDVGIGISAEGLGEIPCQAGTWTIMVTTYPEGERIVLGSKRVNVIANKTVDVTIEIGPIPTRGPG